ncbi:hypothetical protein [Weissella sp. MSCH1]|uniref:hypothetical protein n=1 Tax=Weissella sp. MSCH1 TaxID=3383343 RepID=UPI003896EDE5
MQIKPSHFSLSIAEVLNQPATQLENGQTAIKDLAAIMTGKPGQDNRVIEGVEQIRTKYPVYIDDLDLNFEITVKDVPVKNLSLGSSVVFHNVTGGLAGSANNVVWVNAESIEAVGAK